MQIDKNILHKDSWQKSMGCFFCLVVWLFWFFWGGRGVKFWYVISSA